MTEKREVQASIFFNIFLMVLLIANTNTNNLTLFAYNAIGILLLSLFTARLLIRYKDTIDAEKVIYEDNLE